MVIQDRHQLRTSGKCRRGRRRRRPDHRSRNRRPVRPPLFPLRSRRGVSSDRRRRISRRWALRPCGSFAAPPSRAHTSRTCTRKSAYNSLLRNRPTARPVPPAYCVVLSGSDVGSPSATSTPAQTHSGAGLLEVTPPMKKNQAAVSDGPATGFVRFTRSSKPMMPSETADRPAALRSVRATPR